MMPSYSSFFKMISGDGRCSSSRLSISFFLVLNLLLTAHCFPQRTRIDSLKNNLTGQQRFERVNTLNALSLAYLYLDADTASSFAKRAFEEAVSIQYEQGKAISLNNQARVAGRGFFDFPLQQKVSLQVIELYGSLSDGRILIEAYMNLALSFFCQSLFDQSREACARVVELSKDADDKKGLGEAVALMGSIDFESGNYEKSFEYFNESLKIFKGIRDTHNTAIVLVKIGDLYRLAGDQKTALSFYYQSLEFKKNSSLVWHPLVDLGDTFYSFEQYDSSSYEQDEYGQAIKLLTIQSSNPTFLRIRKAEKYIAIKEYDKALMFLLDDLRRLEKRNDTNYAMRLLLDIARAYEGKTDFGNTLLYANNLLETATKHNAKQYIQNASKLKFSLFDRLHKVDSAYFYYRKYTSMKDSIALNEVSKRLAIYKAVAENEKSQARIELLSKENQINEQQLELREQQLNTESFLKRMLVAGLILSVLLGFILFRNILLKKKNEEHRHALIEQELNLQKLESDRVSRALQQRALGLEMQALRAQMNPHFIFNSLSSINRFILKNEKEQASEYLTKFSRLIRLILQNSRSALISLESELESLKLYLELERVRFDNHFDFRIEVQEDIDRDKVKVPPLIIQPYTENAIWHGLMHKDEKGHVQIAISQEGNLLCCKISDDGIGREKSALLKSKSASSHKSLGMQISADRIADLYTESQHGTFVSITDLVLADGNPGGTEVCLKIPIQYD